MSPGAWTLPIDAPLAASFVSALTRAGGLVMTAPALGGEAAPPILKVLITAGLALAVAPLSAGAARGASLASSPSGPVEATILLASEVLIGAALGFAARVILSAADGAGELLGYQSGVSMAQVLDPLSNQPMNPLGLLEGTVATQAFVAAGGLGWVAIALARSYAAVPAMGILAPQAIGAKVAGLGSWVVEGSMLLVAPAILTGLLIDLLMLVVARTAPAIQLMAVALPIKTLVGLTVLAAVTHHHAPALAALVERARSEIESVLGLMSPMTS